ncbi:MAG: S41 family peptidase [Oscillospiraceae bacterium]
MKKRFGFPALALCCVVSIALSILSCSWYFVNKLGGNECYSAASKFAAIYRIIEDKFVGDADMELVSDYAYGAMVAATEDRWSYYMTAENYEDYKQFQNNSYIGIGITIATEKSEGALKVENVYPGSPAEAAGIKIGDRLKKINDMDISAMTSDEAKTIIADQNGEEFSLELLGTDGKTRSVRISAGEISIEPVESKMLEDGVGYVKILNFETGSGDKTVAAVDKLIAEGATRLVFDLRNNPGGMLSELLKALDHLLPEGVMFISKDSSGEERESLSDAACIDLPMAVLMNENTYSAAEFFGAALSEAGKATLVGTHTTGKSRSQISIELSDGSAVHLSTNGYLTPKHVDLAEAGGLAPDIEVKISEDAAAQIAARKLSPDKDEQLQKAISALKG